eukprot:gene19969-26679_t
MMDASGTTVLYKNKEARQYWDAVGRTPTAGMEARDPATTATAKVMMSLLFQEEVGTVCNTIAKGQTWKGVLAVPQPDHECGSTPSDSASLPSMENGTIRSGRLVHSSDGLPTWPTSESAIQVQHPPVCLEDRVSYLAPGATDGCESLKIQKSDPGNLSSRSSTFHPSPFVRHKIPPTIDETISSSMTFLGNLKQPSMEESFSTFSTILEKHTPRCQSKEPNQSQPHRHRPTNPPGQSTELVKVPKLDDRRRTKSMSGISRLATTEDYCDSVAMGCISSQVHPRGIMASASVSGTWGGLEDMGKQTSRSTALLSSRTLTDASMGLQVSSRSMSIKRPSNDQQSIGNVDGPSSSSHLSRTVSHLGGSPRGSGPLSLPAASMKTVKSSATIGALEFSARDASLRSHSIRRSVTEVATTVDQDISVHGGLVSSAVQARSSTSPHFPTECHPDFESPASREYPRRVRACQSFSERGGGLEIGRQGRRSTALFSSDTLTAASMGFRVSSRLMSILRPSLSRQSIASSDSPPSSTHLPRTVSLLGGSPRGRRSLCLPATSKKTSSRSATTSAVFTPTLPGRRLKHSLSMKAVKRRTTIGDLPSHPRSATWAGSSVDIDDPPLDDHDISLRGGLVSSAVQPGMTIEPRYPSAIDDHDISHSAGG